MLVGAAFFLLKISGAIVSILRRLQPGRTEEKPHTNFDMLTILTQPGDIALSGNQMILECLLTDGLGELYGPQGIRSELKTVGFISIPQDDTLTVSWTEADGSSDSVTFTAKNSPQTEEEIPADETQYISFTEYYTAVADKIKTHHKISPHFKLMAVNNGADISLWMETIEVDDNWQLAWDITGISDPNFSVVNYPNIVADNRPDHLKVQLELFFEAQYLSGDFMPVVTLSAIPDTSGKTTFDISGILDAEVRNSLDDPPIPDFNANTPQKANTLRRYFVRYQELHDQILTPSWSYLDPKLVLCGGIARNLFADYDFFGNLNESNSLLSWYPDGKKVNIDQPEWIAWYNYHNQTHEVVIGVSLMDEDGSVEATLIKHSVDVLQVAPHEILLIPVGYTQLDLDAHLAQIPNPVKYTVQVFDWNLYQQQIAIAYSQKRTYFIDKKHYEEKHYLMHLNGFCLPETLRCVGNFTKELAVQRETSQRILTPGYAASFTEQFQYQEDFENRFTYRTGYLTKAQVDALQELLIHNQLFEVYVEGYIPLLLTENEFVIHDTGQFLFALEIKAIPALKQGYYSNVMIPMEASQIGWRTSGASFWKTVFGLTWKIAN